MGNIRYTFEKPTHGSQKWLDARWKDEEGLTRISASVAAAVHGQHLYTSQADLAVELLSDSAPEPKPTNPAMDRGNRLEPTLIKWYADMEKIEVSTPDVMYAFATEDNKVRLVATLDGITPEGIPVEIKSTNKMWTGKLPSAWYWQGVQQAICVGSDRVEWGVFDSNLEFHKYIQFVSSDEMQIHIDACRAFLSAIDYGVMPDWVELSYEHLEKMHPTSEKSSVELPADTANALLLELDEARAMKSLAVDREDDAKKALRRLRGKYVFKLFV